MEFGLIPHDHWFQPDWIDEDKATEARKKMVSQSIIYGGMSFCLSIISHGNEIAIKAANPTETCAVSTRASSLDTIL